MRLTHLVVLSAFLALVLPAAFSYGESPESEAARSEASAKLGRKIGNLTFNQADGKVVWKTPRKSEAFKKFSFSTPLLITVTSPGR